MYFIRLEFKIFDQLQFKIIRPQLIKFSYFISGDEWKANLQISVDF